MLLIGNLIGLGLGPLAIGVLSDFLEPRFGQESLRYALVLAPAAIVVGALFYFRAARTLQVDMARAESRT
jgi:hypothetical protein